MKNSKSSEAPHQNTKVAVISALITAVSAIAIAFIGIVPQLRQADAQKMEGLKDEISKLQQSVFEMRVLSHYGGTSKSEKAEGQAPHIQLELLQTDTKIPQDQYFSRGNEALKQSDFTGTGTNDQVIFGFDKEYTGLIWSLSSNLVVFVVAGPESQTANEKVQKLKNIF